MPKYDKLHAYFFFNVLLQITAKDIVAEFEATQAKKTKDLEDKNSRRALALNKKEEKAKAVQMKRTQNAENIANGVKRVYKKRKTATPKVDDKACIVCEIKFSDCDEHNSWARCESSDSCNNWCCFNCLPDSFLVNQEFTCLECAD